MFSIETINLFAQRSQEKDDERKLLEKERVMSEIKKYERFNKLIGDREDLYLECKDFILQDVLTSIRSNDKINRDYLIGYQDALEVFMRNLTKYKVAMDKLK